MSADLQSRSEASRPESPAFALTGITRSFGDREAVVDLDLSVPRGCLLGLLGANGSGKTTTLRLLLGILSPNRGQIEILGVSDHDPAALDRVRRARLTYLPEERGLYPRMRVIDLLVFMAGLRGVPDEVAHARATVWMQRLGLERHQRSLCGSLSKGMQQKVQIIAALLHEPSVLVLDEPFSGLDPLNQDVLEQIMLEQQRRGGTIVFSTHQMDRAERLCDRICLLAGGRCVLEGPLGDLIQAADGSSLHELFLRHAGARA